MVQSNPNAGQTGDVRVFITRRFLDTQHDPPIMVDEQLPTRTVRLIGPVKRPSARMPKGTILGSLRLSGTFRDLTPSAPGSYSFRVLRINVNIGTLDPSGSQQWFMRHSRTGTAIIKTFYKSDNRLEMVGGPLTPVMAFGPGTITYGFTYGGTAYHAAQTVEGMVGPGVSVL